MSTQEWLSTTLGLMVATALVVLGCVYWPKLGWIKVRSHPAKSYCIANMKQIDGAIQQWALEQKLTVFDTYSLNDPVLLSYIRGSRLPVCPEGGTYIEGFNVTNHARCTMAYKGHTL